MGESRHVGFWVCFALTAFLPGVPLQAAPADRFGLEFQSLNSEQLDRVREELGKRAGVLIADVRAGSAAAAAGVRKGDLLLLVGDTPVDSPKAVRLALEGPARVRLTLLRSGEFLQLDVVSATPAASPQAPQPAGPASVESIVEAYFDMLDFCRSQAWQRKSTTPAATRARAVRLLAGAVGDIDARTGTALRQIPEAWSLLQREWAAASEEVRKRQRAFWIQTLLSPNPLLPPPEHAVEFSSKGGSVRFSHPADYFIAQTEADDDQFLFCGRRGTETDWSRALDPRTSPAGMLLVITPIDQALLDAKTYIGAARLIARRFVSAGSPKMTELNTLDYGKAGFVVMAGQFAERSESSFCWVGTLRYDSTHLLVCRVIGPMDRVEELLPVFSHMLASARIESPEQQAAGLAVDLYAAMVGNTVVSAGWNH